MPVGEAEHPLSYRQSRRAVAESGDHSGQLVAGDRRCSVTVAAIGPGRGPRHLSRDESRRMNLNDDVVYRCRRLGPLGQLHPGRSRSLIRHHDRLHCPPPRVEFLACTAADFEATEDRPYFRGLGSSSVIRVDVGIGDDAILADYVARLHGQDPAHVIVEISTEPLVHRLTIAGHPADAKCYRNVAALVVEKGEADMVGELKSVPAIGRRLMRDCHQRRTVRMNIRRRRFESLQVEFGSMGTTYRGRR